MAQLNPVVDFKQVDDDLYFDPIIGDFVFVPSDNQHILDICAAYPGWWKNSPSTGAGIRTLLKAKFDINAVESAIKQQLEADGYQVGRPLVNITTNGKATITPNAQRI